MEKLRNKSIEEWEMMYFLKFGDSFPHLMQVELTDEQMIGLMKKAIETSEPVTLDDIENIVGPSDLVTIYADENESTKAIKAMGFSED